MHNAKTCMPYGKRYFPIRVHLCTSVADLTRSVQEDCEMPADVRLVKY